MLRLWLPLGRPNHEQAGSEVALHRGVEGHPFLSHTSSDPLTSAETTFPFSFGSGTVQPPAANHPAAWAQSWAQVPRGRVLAFPPTPLIIYPTTLKAFAQYVRSEIPESGLSQGYGNVGCCAGNAVVQKVLENTLTTAHSPSPSPTAHPVTRLLVGVVWGFVPVYPVILTTAMWGR